MNSKPSSKEIRQTFLDFFAAKGHEIVASSSLVPAGDPTLLFTNAGMNQFKDVFLGFDQRPYTRATSSQKCVRAGGKHNDLENVGYTARHHTFFEMLGNFSFGDYFKHDAIHYAWELLTAVFKLPPDRLLVTVYAEDDEAYTIWAKEIGVAADRIIRIGDNKGGRYASDNFWMMGDTGPCGPCTEIFYDHGEHIPGGPPGSPDEDGDRFVEIWNNVFMQYNRDEDGVMHPLPRPSVDTGMGLERIAAVLQGVHSNYEIDLLQNLIKAAERVVTEAGGKPAEASDKSTAANPSLQVLADHIRACSFLISDGVIPGNEGRGYVLRRIIRRAIRHGYKLGVRRAFFHRMVPDLVAEMGAAYPELAASQQRVMDVLRQEEVRFFETIEHGMSILEAELTALKQSAQYILDGATAFKLHDTYGFPLDLTADICREHNIAVDAAAFDAAMARQKAQARAAGKFKMAANLEYSGQPTTFLGYDTLETSATVLALYRDGSPSDSLQEGDLGVVVLDDTPFYAESGGQIGDSGELRGSDGIFAVEDTQKIQTSVYGHHGVLQTGTLKVGDKITARVDLNARQRTMRNHSATHLMHKALREVLGTHVQQKGSLVDTEKTRFDFVHNAPMTDKQIAAVERLVNAEILTNEATQVRVMPIEEAQSTGAMMLFGEKYGDRVRVLDIGSSCELCGGTHVQRTGDIGLFKITAETGVAAGIRRVEATTGDTALTYIQRQQQTLAAAAAALHVAELEIPGKIDQIVDSVKTLEKELERLKAKMAANQGDTLVEQAVSIADIKLLATQLEGADSKSLREIADKLKDKLGRCVLLLASTQGDKVSLVAAVSKDLTGKIKAGELANHVAIQVGGKGGGRPDMAMAGGSDTSQLPAAIASVAGWVKEKLA